jgi:tripartite-type tricarboxylate transporter receptor subunit TctC
MGDGYTLFVPALAYSVLPLMQGNVGTTQILVPICQTFENQMALIVRPDQATVGTIRRRNGAQVAQWPPYAATAPGTITHLAAAALADAAKVKSNHVPFRGDAS